MCATRTLVERPWSTSETGQQFRENQNWFTRVIVPMCCTVSARASGDGRWQASPLHVSCHCTQNTGDKASWETPSPRKKKGGFVHSLNRHAACPLVNKHFKTASEDELRTQKKNSCCYCSAAQNNPPARKQQNSAAVLPVIHTGTNPPSRPRAP